MGLNVQPICITFRALSKSYNDTLFLILYIYVGLRTYLVQTHMFKKRIKIYLFVNLIIEELSMYCTCI